MRYIFTNLVCFCLFLSSGAAQMQFSDGPLFGNEWIEYDKTYFKIGVAEDGIYRLSGADLQAAGVPSTLPGGAKLQLWNNGMEVPIYVSSETTMSATDEMLFIGERNRTYIDSFLFDNKEMMLNPNLSLISDTTGYYLTWTNGAVKRYLLDDLSTSSTTANITHYNRTITQDYNEAVHSEYKYAQNYKQYESKLVAGEGFSDRTRTNVVKKFYTADYYNDGNNEVEISYILCPHYQINSINLDVKFNDVLLNTHKLSSFNAVTSGKTITVSGLGNPVNLEVSHSTAAEAGKKFALSGASVTYPSKFAARGAYVHPVAQGSASNAIIQLINLSNQTKYHVFDNLNNVYYSWNAGGNNDFVEFSSRDVDFYFTPEGQVKQASIRAVAFTDFAKEVDKDYIILTSKRLYNQANGGTNSIEEYNTYRNSAAGGGYHSIIVFVEDLYNQFSYGVPNHPMAIRNFVQFTKANWDAPQMVHIIGKGRAYNAVRRPNQLAQAINQSFYVPSFGNPAADGLLLSARGDFIPMLPFGRTGVTNLDELSAYLAKVKRFEALEPSEVGSRTWQKEVMHLSGGGDLEIAVANALNRMSNVFETTALNPNITTFYKSSTVVIDSSVTGDIYKKLNEGVGLVTFFGHSGSTTLGFNIENKDKYDNGPIFPILLALGCSSGDHNIAATSVGDYFCLMEDKGFLNMVATNDLGYIGELGKIGQSFYSLYGNNTDGNSYGTLVNQVVQTTDANFRHKSQLQLYGDPAITPFYPEGVDLTVEASSAQIEPNPLQSTLTEFTFSFDIVNEGVNTSEKYQYIVLRELSNGTIDTVTIDTVNNMKTRRSVELTIPLLAEESPGKNTLYVHVDHVNQIQESFRSDSEDNNELIINGKKGYDFIVPSNTITPIWPPNLSIVSSTEVNFTFASGTPWGKERTYMVELDTTPLFNSSLKQAQTIDYFPGTHSILVEDLEAHQVYYWRIMSNDPEENFAQNNLSFIIIPGKEGWNASHHYQYEEVEKNRILYTNNRHWDYLKQKVDAWLKISVKKDEFNNKYPGIQTIETSLWNNTSAWNSIKEGIAVISLDHDKKRLWNSGTGLYGSVNDGGTNSYFAFPNTPEGRDSLIYFIQNIVPRDQRMFVHTVRETPENFVDASDWAMDSVRNNGVNIFNLMESFGATNIRTIENNIDMQYGALVDFPNDYFEEQIANSGDDELIINFNMQWYDPKSDIEYHPDIFLPETADSWLWEVQEDFSADDSLGIEIIRTNPVLNSLNTTRQGGFDLESYRNDFEGVRFSINSRNALYPKFPQFEYVRMTSDDLIGDLGVSVNQEVLSQRSFFENGDFIPLEFVIHNVDIENDPVPFRMEVRHLGTNEVAILEEGNINTQFNGELLYERRIDSKFLAGNYLMTFTLDPNDEFIEITKLNNVVEAFFFVEADKLPPVLDVLFNGVHLQNDVIVPINSSVELMLLEPFGGPQLPLDGLRWTITKPDGTTMDSAPALTEDNRFAIDEIKGLKATEEYTFDQTGQYTIRAKGYDISGNESTKYERTFYVEHSTYINANVLPNPFSDALTFELYITNLEAIEEIDFIISNAQGQIMYQANSKDQFSEGINQMRIDGVDGWSAGVYSYSITAKKNGGGEVPIKYDELNGFGKDKSSGNLIKVAY